MNDKELDGLALEVKTGRMSRRDFMGRTAAMGITAALASTALARVGLAAEMPKRGGYARFGLAAGSSTDSMDPATYPDTFTQVSFWGTMSNSLTEVDYKGEIHPDAAESMEPSNGTKTWMFKLRKGLTFHNGRDVTPADVIASYRYHMGKNSKSAVKPELKTVTDIKADGKHNVIFSLSEANADFPYIASDYHLPIMPANKDGTADWQSGIRTGPFVLEKFVPGNYTKFKRFAHYHKPGKPYFDEVKFLAITDVTARTNALTTGEVDFIGRADLKTLRLLKRNPKIQINEVTGYGYYVFVMNTTQPPFDNPHVRNALKWAIDRKAIANKVFLGHATPGDDDPIAPAIKYAVEPKPVHAYNVEQAKAALKKAGLSSLKVDLSVADAAFNGAVDAAVLFQNSAAKAGIDINVVREPDDGYWDKVWLKKPFCASYWNGRPTCDWMFTIAYAPGAAWNETYWKNPRFDKLLVEARGETDNAKRAKMYAEMQQLVHDDGGVIVMVFNDYVSANSKKVAHGTIAGNWEVDGLKIAERWWFA